MPSYTTHKKFINNFKSYSQILKRRGLKEAAYLNTPVLLYPTIDEINKLNISYEVWQADSRVYELSHKYYGNTYYGWLILFFNKLGSEYEIKNGQVLSIPSPLDTIIGMVGQ